MLSQDAKNLSQSIRILQKQANQLAHILNCVAINMDTLTNRLEHLEKNVKPVERPYYEDVSESA